MEIQQQRLFSRNQKKTQGLDRSLHQTALGSFHRSLDPVSSSIFSAPDPWTSDFTCVAERAYRQKALVLLAFQVDSKSMQLKFPSQPSQHKQSHSYHFPSNISCHQKKYKLGMIWCIKKCPTQPLFPLALSAAQFLFAFVLPWQSCWFMMRALSCWEVRSPSIPRHMYRMTLNTMIYIYIYTATQKSHWNWKGRIAVNRYNEPTFPCPSLWKNFFGHCHLQH